MEDRYGIDPGNMNRVPGQMKLTGEELITTYENYRSTFLPELFRDMGLHEAQCFTRVYSFEAQTVPAMRGELSAFVKVFSLLYGDTLEEVPRKMDYYLKWCNAHNPWPVPFLNWATQFAGTVQHAQPNAQIAYMREHTIPYRMTGFIPE